MESSKASKNEKNEEFAVKTEKLSEASSDSSSSSDESDDDVKGSTQCSKSVGSIVTESTEKKDQAEEEQDKDKEGENKEPLTSPEDKEEMLALSRLPQAALVAYIQELDAEIYELGQREARELSRSKHLRIFGNNRRRANKRE